ncbi:hypothetical protein Lal_00027623 [Lupinus albus]|nr:hypothetical protein Lal_00027623 [Lupinus albus]
MPTSTSISKSTLRKGTSVLLLGLNLEGIKRDTRDFFFSFIRCKWKKARSSKLIQKFVQSLVSKDELSILNTVDSIENCKLTSQQNKTKMQIAYGCYSY